jgi:hypothetical protein
MVHPALPEQRDAFGALRFRRRDARQHQDLGEGLALGRREVGEGLLGRFDGFLADEFQQVAFLDHRRRDGFRRVPGFHRDDRGGQARQVGAEKLERGLAAAPRGRIDHQQVAFFVGAFPAGLDGVLPRLAHEETVHLEILADQTVVETRHWPLGCGRTARLVNPR